jgi:hypothetical protein
MLTQKKKGHGGGGGVRWLPINIPMESIWSTLRFLRGSTPEDYGISYEKFV